MIQLQPVTGSSTIAAQGYDLATQRLAVVFLKGKYRYEYRGVPERVAQEFASAQSLGQYHREHIRDSFEFDRLDLSQEDASFQDQNNG